jgi:hypothetical protein
MLTGMSPQNSQINCRHAPQGGVSTSVSVTTAMALKPRSPSLTALKIATRSAHIVSPYVAFSTLQPEKILPEMLRKAAPTRKFEYGACAFSLACLAASISKSFSVTSKLRPRSLHLLSRSLPQFWATLLSTAPQNRLLPAQPSPKLLGDSAVDRESRPRHW